jgi:uncharacterized membrane protein YfcA
VDFQTIFVLLIIGLLAGLLSGFMGVGGGIIIVPALVFFLHLDQQTAQGTSLAAIMLLPVGAIAVYNYWKAGKVNFEYSAVILLFFLVGSYFGSKLSLRLDPLLLKRVFAGLMILIAIRLLLSK